MQRKQVWYREGVFALALAGTLTLGHVALPTMALAEEGDTEPAATAPAGNDNADQGNDASQQNTPATTPAPAVVNTTPSGSSTDPVQGNTNETTPNQDENLTTPATTPGSEGDGEDTLTTPGTEGDEQDAIPLKEVPIEDGKTLTIETGVAGQEKQVLDAKGGKSTDGTNIQMHTFNDTIAQKYTFEKAFTTIKKIVEGQEVEDKQYDYDDEGNPYYWIKRSGTDQAFTVVGETSETSEHTAKKGANVALYAADESLDGQKWKILDMANGVYKVVSKLVTADDKTLVLDIAGGASKLANGTNIQVWTDNGSDAQRFAFIDFAPTVAPSNVDITSGAYTVSAKNNTNMVADIANGSADNGANLRIWSSNNSNAQSMIITSDGEGFYTIGILNSGKVFDVEGGSFFPGANVRQWNSNGSDAQKWAIHLNTDGSYSFINKKNGLLLDIAGGVVAKGTNIMVYRNTGSADAQCFALTRIEQADTNIFGVGDLVSATSVYTITPVANSELVLDIKSGSKEEGGLLELWTSNGSLAQKFQLERVKNMYAKGSDSAYQNNQYLIRTASSGDYLQDMGEGVQLQQTTTPTIWEVVWDQRGFYVLKSLDSGLVLDVRNGSYTKGNAIQAAALANVVSQHFLFTKTELVAPNYYFIETDEGTTLDIAGGSTAAGANAQIWNLNKSDAQKFQLVKVGDFYQLINLKSGKAISGGGEPEGSYPNVEQRNADKTDQTQLWKLTVGNDGFVELVNVASGFNLFSRGRDKGENVAEKDLRDKAIDENAHGRSWTFVAATGWFYQNGHWRYVSADSRASFEDDVDSKGKSLGHYDILYTLWRYVNGKISGSNKCFKSKTGYLIISSWDNAYLAIFKGKANVTVADNWEPLVGTNIANGLGSKIEAQNRVNNPGSKWKWDPNWDRNLGEGNASIKNLPAGSEWAYSLGYKAGQSNEKGSYNWTHSRKAKVNSGERWFTSVSTTLGYHTFIGGDSKAASQVGRHISYGCQRLLEKWAKFIYDNIGPGTRCLQRTNAKMK